MKKQKSIDLLHQSKTKTAETNISSPSKPGNKYYKNYSRNIKKPSQEKKRKVFSHDSFNDEELTNIHNNEINLTCQNIKKNSTNNNKREKSRNSKLTPANYIKPLFYILNNQIKPIYKQFKGYRNEKYFINFNYNLFPSFKNGDINMIKTMSNNDNNLYLNYTKNSINNKNIKKKMQNRSFDDNLKHNKFISDFNNSQEDKDITNTKAKLLQAYFRSFISRYKFFNELKNNKDKNIKYSEIVLKLMNNFFEKLNAIKNDFSKLKKNILNDKLIEYKNISFTIKRKNNKNRKTLTNNNLYLIKQQKEALEKEKEQFIKEKKLNELKIRELTEENNKLKKKNSLTEKYKLNSDKLKEENDNLKLKINELEERNKECNILEIKYKNLQEQNEALYQENLGLNKQIEEKINNLIEINKKNQEKIKLYEKTMLNQESVINENKTLNDLNNDYKNRMKQLLEENSTFKEKLKNNETKINNEKQEEKMKKENAKLISENKVINKKNEELQIQLDEIKKKLKKIEKANKFANKFINDNSSNPSAEKSHTSTPYEKNDELENQNTNSNHELYLNRVRERKNLTDEEIKKQSKLQNLLKRRISDIKDDLHKCFMRFYYNGIFVQQQKRNKMKEPITKVVKSKRFSALISKFSGGLNNKDEIVDNKNNKRRQTKSYDDKMSNNLEDKNNFEEDKKDE